MSDRRLGCYYCFGTLDPQDKQGALRAFVKCSHCGTHYHTVCWRDCGKCLRCGGDQAKTIDISRPVPLRAVTKTRPLPTDQLSRQGLGIERLVIPLALALLLVVCLASLGFCKLYIEVIRSRGPGRNSRNPISTPPGIISPPPCLDTPPMYTPTRSPAHQSFSTPSPTPVISTPIPTSVTSCPGAPAQRVRVGDRVWVCTKYDRLIVREQPRLSSREIARLEPGTYVKIINGPTCANSYSWWKIRTDSGPVGWVSEGGDNVDPYFICPAR